MSFLWTEDTVARLRALAGEGLSAAQIGAQLGISRNAVIGKLLREKGRAGRLLNKPRNGQGGRPRRNGAPAVPALPASPPVARPAPRPVELPRPVLDFAPPIAADHALTVPPSTFLDAVLAGRCLFFAGDPYSPGGPEMPVCGCERSAQLETRYCPRHLRRQHEAAA